MWRKGNIVSLKHYFSLKEKAVVSFIGAGGKTSLMFALAHELAASGSTVLTTTTTKIFMPSPQESPITIVSNEPRVILEEARFLLSDHLHLSAGVYEDSVSSKLIGFKPEELAVILDSGIFDYILIEADGAARRPLKACAETEPVVPSFTDVIIYVAGLDVLGKPLGEQWVFRPDLFSVITGLALGQPVTEKSIVEILIHDVKSVSTDTRDIQRHAFLNKADNRGLLDSAKRIATSIEEVNRGLLKRVIIGVLKGTPTILSCHELE